MTQKEKMHSGDLYLPGDKEIMTEQMLCLERHDKEYYFKTRKINLE